ncbi:MCE family protein [Euzebya sp.]|uniref:MCE family protein n=1 Tax=Euzebya sp. TaxID=1971409 RepID=UPI0035158B34
MGIRVLAAILTTLALLATGCGGEEPIVVNAQFSDVADLTTNAAVKLADVTIGTVEGIELDGDLMAAVRMEIDPTIELPSELIARLRKTSVLGERYIELTPVEGAGGTWESGGTVAQTEVVPELEEVVATSTDLLIAISTDTLAGAISSGAAGLDGRGQTMGQVIDDLEQVTRTYNANSADLVRLLDGLDQFLDTVGPQAEVHGRALEEATTFVRVLAEEDDRLIDTLTNLRDLADTGEDIIITHRARIDDFVTYLEGISGELIAPEHLEAIDTLFVNVAQHNFATIRGVNQENAQVVLDFIICGLNDEPGYSVRACTDPPQGRPQPTPRPPQDF